MDDPFDRHLAEDSQKPSGGVVSFSIGELAALAGVSTRTLRHYESCGLLLPARTANGYRVYSQADAKRLAQILAMRQCGLPLVTIRRMMSVDAEDVASAASEANIHSILDEHLRTLQMQRGSLEEAIGRTKTAIAAIERIERMDTKDAFEEMKEQGLKDFEATYGQEARKLYGDEAIDAANERMMSLTKDEWDAKELLEDAIKVQLRLAMQTGDPASVASRELAHMHERWIAVHWGEGYREEEYMGLVLGYLGDPRFVKYYDSAAGEGATDFLVRAVEAAHARA